MGSAVKRCFALFTLCLPAAACSLDGGGGQPVMSLSVHGENQATLSTDGQLEWYANAIPEADYDGYGTRFESGTWEKVTGGVSLQVIQRRQQWLGAGLTLADDAVIRFDYMSFGFGWREVHSDVEKPVSLDLEALGMAPSGEAFEGVDLSDCTVENARVVVALSASSESEEELIDEATESATDQGLPNPKDWYDVVLDDNMYQHLFEEQGTDYLGDTTFAFLTIELAPRCGDHRVVLATEEELVGPVERP